MDGTSDPVVAVDCAGADKGPAEVAAGALIAAREGGVRSLLFGAADEIRAGLDEHSELIEVVDAPVSIAKASDPVAAVRSTQDASIVQAMRAVAKGQADAFVSGGSTGPALAAGTLLIKRVSGIYRPALALSMPRTGRRPPVIILDVGANADTRSEQLVQFAHMGTALCKQLTGNPLPRVALLSNGSEPERGAAEVVEAHAELAAAKVEAMEFVGNVEGDDLLGDKADVVVTGGFAGNIALKVSEGVSDLLFGAIRTAAALSPGALVGGWLMRRSLSDLRAEIDPERFGGAFLLGLRAPGVIPHGRFSRTGFANAIVIAAEAARDGLVNDLTAALEVTGALRLPFSESGTTA